MIKKENPPHNVPIIYGMVGDFKGESDSLQFLSGSIRLQKRE